jgi:hypothetical protein
MIWYIYIYAETLIKKKKELSLCSKDLDNPTYGLFKKPGRYIVVSEQLALRTVGKWILLEIKFLGSIWESMPEHRL